MAIIELKNVTMSYEGSKVINELSISIEKGDYVCIVGENGSGKTTLIKGLLGLKGFDGGEIIFGEGLRKNEIGYLPQQSEMQRDFPASVKEVVRSGRINRKGLLAFFGAKDRKICDNAMKKLEIDHLAQKCYHELSGGQQQRVLLARAICASEHLLILDEPVSSLDVGAAEEMYEVIKKLHDEGMTIIMISHDIEKALASADYVLHLGNQKALYYGKSKDYKAHAIEGGFWEREK